MHLDNLIKDFTSSIAPPIIILSNGKGGENMEDNMNTQELTQKNIEEFSRLQSYMVLVDKNSEAYKTMKIRYIELKVILTTSGVNLNELDVISE